MPRSIKAAAAAALIALAAAGGARAEGLEPGHVHRVLLISIDGLHALDVANYVQAHPRSTLAELAGHGLTFSNARTPSNSDSFPGLLALVTGGTPRSHGVFYDVSYDRSIWPPDHNGCSGPPGTQMIFDETIDVYVNEVSRNVIDPGTLPFWINPRGECVRMFPHDALRVNTLFEVVHAAHAGRTAWADKHPAYDLVNGPSGSGVDDLYTPEITNAPGFDNTISVVCTAQNDDLKVAAIINEIRGLDHSGTRHVGVPKVFGMNFQAVSVGQKLLIDNPGGGCATDTNPAINGQRGGYADGAGTPGSVLAYGLHKTDASLGRIVEALKDEHLYDSTLIIVTAKHGQSPLNLAKLTKPGHFADLVCKVGDCTVPGAAKIIADAGNNCPEGPCGFVQDDDIALIWLPDQGQTRAVADFLNQNANALFIEEVLAGNELNLRFNNPRRDSRTPDLIVQPVYGTIYTGAGKNKLAEHGGFSFGDTNVGLIVSHPDLEARLVKTPVLTSQVAPTILRSIGLEPDELQAVKKEGITVLPFVF